jgi:hypothetical protein
VSRNGHHAWRLRVELPSGYDEDTTALFTWLREHLIPCCLAAPIRITLQLVPPEKGELEDS